MKEVGRVQMGYLKRILELNFVQVVTMLFQIAISICIRNLLFWYCQQRIEILDSHLSKDSPCPTSVIGGSNQCCLLTEGTDICLLAEM